jgi:hypothetical protein
LSIIVQTRLVVSDKQELTLVSLLAAASLVSSLFCSGVTSLACSTVGRGSLEIKELASLEMQVAETCVSLAQILEFQTVGTVRGYKYIQIEIKELASLEMQMLLLLELVDLWRKFWNFRR